MVLLSLNGFFSSFVSVVFCKSEREELFKPFWKHARRVQARSHISFLVDAIESMLGHFRIFRLGV